MKGQSLQQLAVEIERQAESKKDYIAPAQKLKMVLDGGEHLKPMLSMQNGQAVDYGINDTAHDQLAGRLDIPRTYYDKMRQEHPQLLATNVNGWLARSDKRFMVRTLDTKVRAVLSDRYRPLDNVDLAEAVLPIIADKRWEIRDCAMTEQRLYIKIVSKELQALVPRDNGQANHVVHPGLMISNSEIGMGAVRVTPSLHWPHCFNIALMDEAGTSRFHTGRRDERFGDLATEFFADETRKQDDLAFWMKVRDIVSATITEGLFTRLVEKFRQSVDAKIEGDPVKVIELTGKRFGFGEAERSSILKHLIQGGDLNLYGLSAAITATAQDVESYDRGTELERFGGEIVELSRNQWKELQAA